MKRKWWLKGVVIMVLMLSAGSALVMFLWNQILPSVTSFSPINYFQAFGLLLLARILFGGAGRWHAMKKKDCAQGIRNKMENLSPEEKEKFRQFWEWRCNKWNARNMTGKHDEKSSET